MRWQREAGEDARGRAEREAMTAMAGTDFFDVQVPEYDSYGPRSVFTCPRCFALVLGAFERDHEAWHRDGDGRLMLLEEANPA